MPRAIITAFVLILVAPLHAAEPPHEWELDACLRCHATGDEARLELRRGAPCAEMCVSCHAGLEPHHRVGLKIEKRPSADLQLTARDTITCITCHDLAARPTSRQPWIAQSFFERMRNRGREHRTYLLVMRNDRGQLCRNCH